MGNSDKTVPASGESGRDVRREVLDLYAHLLKRVPTDEETDRWVARVSSSGLSFSDAFQRFAASAEYLKLNRVKPGHPVGHYHSPIPDPEELRSYFRVDYEAPLETLLAINISDDALLREFDELRPHLAGLELPAIQTVGRRYYVHNGFYGDGDASILAAMLGRFRPSRVIEIGSGFSTACMLDTIALRGLNTSITCIEPYPARLHELLTDGDAERVEVIAERVQNVSLDVFAGLSAGDILFIDSTHVLRTGSDVCFELFELLPRLPAGVVVHLHDIPHPFEYSERWVYQKRYAWNEVYALRAFLMYNAAFSIIAYNGYFNRRFRSLLEDAYGGTILSNGASLWLRVNDAPG